MLRLSISQRTALEEARQQLLLAVSHQQAAIARAGAPSGSLRSYLCAHQGLLCETLLRLGDYVQAAAAAEELPRFGPGDPERLVEAAGILVQCGEQVGGDRLMAAGQRDELKGAYLNRAIQLLREGLTLPNQRVAVRERLLEYLKRNRFDGLRRRDDFQRLLKEAENQLRIGIG